MAGKEAKGGWKQKEEVIVDRTICAVWGWGVDQHGQLSFTHSVAAVAAGKTIVPMPRLMTHLRVDGAFDVNAVAAAHHNSALLTWSGQVFTWGKGAPFLGIGIESKDVSFKEPQKVEYHWPNKPATLVAGAEHIVVLDAIHDAHSWGTGYFGRLASESPAHRIRPAPAFLLKDEYLARLTVAAVACGANHTVFLTTGGSVYTCGHNASGQCGDGTNTESKLMPVKVTFSHLKGYESKAWVAAAAGAEHTLLMARDGSLVSFGQNTNGQLGDGSRKPSSLAVVVKELKNAAKVAAGRAHSAAINTSHHLYLWGCGEEGQLGTEAVVDLPVPRVLQLFEESEDPTMPAAQIDQVALGSAHTVALSLKGSVYAFGSRKGAQATTEQEEFKNHMRCPLRSIEGVSSISAGSYHTLALINQPGTLLMQHIRDGDMTSLREFLASGKAQTNYRDPVRGWDASHLAAHLGRTAALSVLVPKFITPHTIVGNSTQRTALHLACIAGHLEAVNTLLTLGSRISARDVAGMTPLHHALDQGHVGVARALAIRSPDFEVRDVRDRTVFDLCTAEVAYELKQLAKYHDVIVLHHISDTGAAKRLTEAIAKNHVPVISFQIKDDTKKEEVNLQSAKGVVFIVTRASHKSKACVDILEHASRLRKQLFPVWGQKLKLDGAMEALLFRYQLVDFSQTDAAAYVQATTALVNGLRNIYNKDGSNLAVSRDDRDDLSRSRDLLAMSLDVDASKLEQDSHRYVFLSTENVDAAVAEEIETFLSRTIEVRGRNVKSVKLVGQLILRAAAVLVVLSPKSLKAGSRCRDQLALAENHRKLLLPVQVSHQLDFDAAMSYTFAQAPIFDLSPRVTGRTRTDTLALLAAIVSSAQTLSAETFESAILESEIQVMEKDIAKQEQLLARLKTAIGDQRK